MNAYEVISIDIRAAIHTKGETVVFPNFISDTTPSTERVGLVEGGGIVFPTSHHPREDGNERRHVPA